MGSNVNHACEPSINSDSITLPKLPLPRTFSNLKSSTPYFLNVGRDLTGGSLKLHRDSRLLFASALSLSLGLEESHPISELIKGVPLIITFFYNLQDISTRDAMGNPFPEVPGSYSPVIRN